MARIGLAPALCVIGPAAAVAAEAQRPMQVTLATQNPAAEVEADVLGQPASHGCIRLATDQAKIFFDLVKEYGMPSTLISVVN